MKIITLLMISLLALSACSFKKNKTQESVTAPVSPEKMAQDLILNSNEADALKKIENFSSTEVQQMNAQADHLRLALQRGNSSILIALLNKGFSPYSGPAVKRSYTFEDTFDQRTFSIMTIYNTYVAGLLDTALELNDFVKFKSILDTLGMSCESVMDLHQESRLNFHMTPFSKNDERFLTFLKNLPNCQLESSSHKSDWTTKEILKLYVHKETIDNPQLFIFLLSLLNNQKFEFKSDLIPNLNEIDPKVITNYKIDLLNSAEHQTALRINWVDPLSSWLSGSEVETWLDQNYNYHFRQNNISRSEMDGFMSSRFLNYLTMEKISLRKSCFIHCEREVHFSSPVDFSNILKQLY